MLGRFTLAQLVESRLAIESFIARRACEVGEMEEFDALELNIETTAKIPLTNWDARLASYGEFLNVFIGAAHNPLLTELAKPLIESTAQLVRRLGPRPKDEFLKFRRQLVAALKERDPDRASAVVVQTMKYIYKSLSSRA